MLELFLAALMMVICIVFLLARLNLRRWLGYTVLLDIVVTIAMLGLFAGTFSGVVAGAITGVIFSVTLEILKRVLGYERLGMRGWVSHPPKWSFTSFSGHVKATAATMAARVPAKRGNKKRGERIEPTFEGISPNNHKRAPRAFSVDRVTPTNDDWIMA